MRTTQAFFLRLLVDTDERDALRGTLHAVASGEDQPFADEAALLALLRRMVNAAPETIHPGKEKKENKR